MYVHSFIIMIHYYFTSELNTGTPSILFIALISFLPSGTCSTGQFSISSLPSSPYVNRNDDISVLKKLYPLSYCGEQHPNNNDNNNNNNSILYLINRGTI